jgi:hypothetical protein
MPGDSKEKSDILEKLRLSIIENGFVRFTLGKYRGKEEELENLYVEPVMIQDEVMYSFRYKYKTKDIFKNHDFEISKGIIEDHLGKDFLYGALYTTSNDTIIEYNKKREPRMYSRKPTFTRVQITGQNKIKPRFISNRSKYMEMLGITNHKGEVKNDKYYKFRQIDKFIEIVDSLYRDSHIESKEDISIIDFGSGKSYLTFAIYDYFRNKLDKNVTVTGIELRNELVELSNKIAEDCGFEGLTFTSGTITSYPAEKADIVVALHACDTATDDAIAKAIESESEIIILAPCCQKYVRTRIKVPENLKSIFHHGIIEEHVSSFITDGLRALELESAGYKTKVFEFISQEHTSKNIMITAVKTKADENVKMIKQMEIENIKSEFGLEDFYLDKIIT